MTSPSSILARITAVALVALAALLYCAARAADFPAGPIKLVVPFAAGGTTDLLARQLAQELRRELRQPVVVENRPGAGGAIAAGAVARAAPDGLTLLIGTVGTQITNKYLTTKLPYNPDQDFAPVIYLADVPGVILTHPKTGLRSMPDLVNAARARPGQLSWGSPGVGSTGHLMVEMFEQISGTKVNHVPYKGAAQANGDLVAGILDAGGDNVPTALPLIHAGSLVPLGVTGLSKVSSLPQVETVDKTLPGYRLDSWFALMAPAATPEAVLIQLNQVLDRMIRSSDFGEKLKNIGALPVGGSPSQLAEHLRKEDRRFKELILKAGIKPE